MNFFGRKKKDTGASVTATPRVAKQADPAESIVKLREAIATQEKRYDLFFLPSCLVRFLAPLYVDSTAFLPLEVFAENFVVFS
mmetsp:Transcript_44596/g.67233  ORF Transcript_44596/g.67233 Transcript_44596/m.67233 type:complete len:83 (-) Transcript_44596:30-278(-)